jgi:hypothetical protein
MCGNVSASTRTIKFTNKAGQDVDDLHIIFSNKTSVTTNPFGNDKTPAPNDAVHNFWGETVKADESITLAFSSVFETLTIGEWWWTKGGNARQNGERKGDKKKDDGGTDLSFLDEPATGDGAVLVTIGGTGHTFRSTAGFSAAQSATAFDHFLAGLDDNGFALISSALMDNTKAQSSATFSEMRTHR